MSYIQELRGFCEFLKTHQPFDNRDIAVKEALVRLLEAYLDRKEENKPA